MGELSDRYHSRFKGRNVVSAAQGTTNRQLGGVTPATTKSITPRPSNVEQFGQKLASVAGQTFNLGRAALSKTAGFVANTGKDIGSAAIGSARTARDLVSQPIINRGNQQLSDELDRIQNDLVEGYKSGRISRENYIKATEQLGKAFNDVSEESKKVSTGPSPQQRAMELVETAANLLTLGRGTTIAGASKGAAKAAINRTALKQGVAAVDNEAIEAIVRQTATSFEKQLLKVPALSQLVERNLAYLGRRQAQKLIGESTSQFIMRESREIAANLLIKRPIFYQQNINDATKTFNQILDGDYDGALKTSAWMASQMLRGGPLGAFFEGSNWAKGKVRELAYGNQSFIDEISKRIGNYNPNQIAKFITKVKENTGTYLDTMGVRVRDVSFAKGVDAGIADELESINAAGYKTIQSMSGLAADYQGKGLSRFSKDGYIAFAKQDLTEKQLDDIRKAAKKAGLYVDEEHAIFGVPSITVRSGKLKNGKHWIELRKEADSISGVDSGEFSLDKIDARNKILKEMKEQAGGYTDDAGRIAMMKRFAEELNPNYKPKPTVADEVEKVFRVMQEGNLRAANEDVQRAVDNVLSHYEQHGYDLTNVTPSQLFKDMRNWQQADELAQKTLRSGLVKDISPEDAHKYVVVRWDQTARNGLIATLEAAGPDRQAQLDAMYTLANRPGVGWGNNQILMNKIEQAIINNTDPKETAKAIKAITAAGAQARGVPKAVKSQLAKLGYTIAEPLGGRTTPLIDPDDTRKLVSGAVRGNTELFDPSRDAEPVMSAIAGFIKKAGISPESANKEANRKLAEAVVANLTETGVAKEIGLGYVEGGDMTNGGRAILSKLQQYIENKSPNRLGNALVGRTANASAITDIRQLTVGNIADALHVSDSQAKAIAKAIVRGYQDVPLEYRGLGDKLVDTLYSINPAYKYYSRIQSALRYTYNPFFRVQESVETRALSRVQANNLLWNKSRAELDQAVKVLDETGFFTSSLPGEAAQDQVLGRLTASLTMGQKRDLAGLAEDLASARGMTLKEVATNHPEDIEDALRIVVQYPRQGLFASPLARTLNVAFFPMRYNTKVTYLAAREIAKQPPSVQKAVVHSIFRMRDWLKSDEGIQWQSDNNDALQVLKWVTPIGSITYTLGLLGHSPDSIASLGQLGGLPIGVISQMLDSQGIISLNKPYVNPETGDVIPKYIPKTTQARAAIAVGDLINSMFTYPGRTLGLPGKGEAIRSAVRAFIDTNGEDFEKRIDEEALTPLQRNWIRVLKGDTSKEALDVLYNSPAEGQFQWYTLPPLDLPMKKPLVEPRRNLPSKKKAGTKKKTTAQPML